MKIMYKCDCCGSSFDSKEECEAHEAAHEHEHDKPLNDYLAYCSGDVSINLNTGELEYRYTQHPFANEVVVDRDGGVWNAHSMKPVDGVGEVCASLESKKGKLTIQLGGFFLEGSLKEKPCLLEYKMHTKALSFAETLVKFGTAVSKQLDDKVTKTETITSVRMKGSHDA